MDLSILVIAGKWNTARMTGLEMTVRLREGLTEAKLCEKSPQFVYQRRCRCFGVSYWKRTSIQMKLRLSKSTMQNLVCRNLHFKPCHVSMRAEHFIQACWIQTCILGMNCFTTFHTHEAASRKFIAAHSSINKHIDLLTFRIQNTFHVQRPHRSRYPK
jgi:hypothetical protein